MKKRIEDLLTNLDLVIFDLDGTLIDSNGVSNQLDVELVHWLGDKESLPEKILSERDNVIANNKSGDIYLNYCEYLRKKYNSKFSKEEILQHRRDLSKELSKDIKFKPDADKMIKYLKKQNIKLALATVSRKETIDIYINDNEHIKNKCNLQDYFDYIITKDDVKLKKPNPEVYNKIIDKFKINDLSRCLVIEDSLTGVLAAKKANLNVIVMYDKYSNKDREKIEELADYNVNNYAELIELFKQANENNIKNMISPCVFRKRETDKFLAFIEITNSCNMKCKHCMNWSVKDSKEGFSKEEILKLIDDLYKNKTEEIYISGGEPLLYPYIDEVILYANSLGIKVTLATNALEIPKHMDAIKKGVQLVSISLDGIGETHDKLRGVKGAFDNCVKILKLLKENNVKTRISAMIWKENVEQLEDMIVLAKTSGVSKVNLAFLIPEGRAKTDNTIKLPTSKYKEIVEIVDKLREKYKSDDFDIELRRNRELDENSMDCPGGRNLMHINVNGKVSPCSWIAKTDNNNEFSLYWPKNSIEECIEKFQDFVEIIKSRKEKYGYSGCIALSYIYNGGFLEKDPLNDFLKE